MTDRSTSDPDALLADLVLFGIRLGLDSTRSRLLQLGSPERQVPIVLVAGTNGKGSTAALLAAMATAAGYRTGLYTSPHLEAVEERLRLDGRTIRRERLAHLLRRVLATTAEPAGKAPGREPDGTATPLPPTYFEALTLAAFLWFAEEQADLAVFEVGLGGRLDATNACEPSLSVITEIALDHQAHLGHTLPAIAREKAGILRSKIPAVTWISDDEARRAVESVAAELKAPLSDASSEVRLLHREPLGWQGQRLVFETPLAGYDLSLPFLGAHQADNLALALRAAEVLESRGFPRLGQGARQKGAVSCRWPGRLEVVELPGNRRVVLEGAHNADGARRLRAFLDEVGERADFLFGVLADKDAAAMIAPLRPVARRWILTTPEHPRALRPESLVEILEAGAPAPDPESVILEADPRRALSRALDKAPPSDAPEGAALAGAGSQSPRTGSPGLGGPGLGSPGLGSFGAGGPDPGGAGQAPLVVWGSLYLVGQIRDLLHELYGVPTPAAALSTGSG